jgi:hypothetical protein
MAGSVGHHLKLDWKPSSELFEISASGIIKHHITAKVQELRPSLLSEAMI